MRSSIASVFILFSGVVLSGCNDSHTTIDPFGSGTKVVDSATTMEKYRPNLPANTSGLRAAISVAAFGTVGKAASSGEYRVVDSRGETHTIVWGAREQNATGFAMAAQLESALAMTDHFVVNVRGATFDSLRSEHGLAEEGWVDEQQVVKGGLVSPDLFVNATILEWSPNVKGGGAGLGGFLSKWPIIGGLKWDNSISRVALQLQIVNRRQQIVATIPVEVEAKSTDWTAGGLGVVSGALVGGVLNQYSNTTMEEAIAVAIRTSVERIYTSIPRTYFRPAGGTNGDEVISMSRFTPSTQ